MLSSGGREGRVFMLDHAGQRTIEKSNKNSAYNLALFLQLHIVCVCSNGIAIVYIIFYLSLCKTQSYRNIVF